MGKPLSPEQRLDRYQKKHPNIILNKEFFQLHYCDLSKSLPDMLRDFGIPYATTQFCVKHFNLEYRGLKHPKTNKSGVEKRKAYYLKVHGVENCSQVDAIKEKKRQTCIKKYGVDNYRKSEEFKEYYRQTMRQRYGKGSLPNRFGNKNKAWEKVGPEERKKFGENSAKKAKAWWNSLPEEEKEKRIAVKLTYLSRSPSFTSKQEALIAETLTKAGIEFKTQVRIGRFLYDFQIGNILLEVQGDFWHANPKKYKPNDLLPRGPNLKVLASELWDKDQRKREKGEAAGFIVKQIWESEIGTGKNILKQLQTLINGENQIDQKS